MPVSRDGSSRTSNTLAWLSSSSGVSRSARSVPGPAWFSAAATNRLRGCAGDCRCRARRLVQADGQHPRIGVERGLHPVAVMGVDVHVGHPLDAVFQQPGDRDRRVVVHAEPAGTRGHGVMHAARDAGAGPRPGSPRSPGPTPGAYRLVPGAQPERHAGLGSTARTGARAAWSVPRAPGPADGRARSDSQPAARPRSGARCRSSATPSLPPPCCAGSPARRRFSADPLSQPVSRS